mmetsp:Transcript_89900/g.141990  ORF Transcript_89900/g.141990 Transcript_89900/m.141990 type:complete len:147 (-) Transcript_89900:99-539(-)|eukprot:CAMPEP_0169133660 /NCGR_PEP_ID=MMETSP1015-20121227/39433_1 /TAXON_ID=342587 /ORGANISM="Karlodinium micrum, Strain CCMP2283" /LENGTH=146 /DNA_ID=CAMNT_0009198071 /DNA_START=39 /DNA_END=479 /DNA_ORIENTATION=-
MVAAQTAMGMAFKAFDRDGDDRLGVQDLAKILSVFSAELKDTTLEDLSNGLATKAGASGGMTSEMLNETVEAYRGDANTGKDQVAIMQRLSDPDGTGLVGPAALQQALALLGLEATEADAKEMIREVDRDQDGMITSEEFMALMSK